MSKYRGSKARWRQIFPLSKYPDEILSKEVWNKYLMTPDLEPMAELVKIVVQRHGEDVMLRRALRQIRCCHNNYPHFLASKLTAIFASVRFEPEVRKCSVVIFHDLLVVHDKKGTPLTYLNIVEYGKNLLSLPATDALPGVELGLPAVTIWNSAIARLASRLFSVMGERDWRALREYMSSTLPVSFRRPMLIFQQLLVPLPEDFLLPLVDEMWSRIRAALEKPASESESDELPAFAGGHALMIQLMRTRRADLAEEILLSMGDSAARLAKLGLEITINMILCDIQLYIKRNAGNYDAKAYEMEYRFIRKMDRVVGEGSFMSRVIIKDLVMELEVKFPRRRRRA